MSAPGRASKAFILCGGLGTRLRSVLTDRPKSMALVAGIPFLQLLIEKLRAEKIQELVLGTGYMAETIERYFGRGEQLGVLIHYSRETEPLGTGGAVKNAIAQLDDPILILNGDSYVEWDLDSLQQVMRTNSAELVILLQRVPDTSRYGSVTLDDHQRIIQFTEKGTNRGAGLINAGIYLLRKEVIDRLPAGITISLERDVFPLLLKGKVYGCITDGTFIDIGIPEDLERAQTLLAPGGDRKTYQG